MNGPENRPVIKTHGEPTRILRSHPMAAVPRDSLEVEDYAAIRALFELLATWDREGQRN
jgi:hypothetical protein